MQETNLPVKVSKARRRWAILEYMRNAPGRSQIATLSHRFGVSEMTIRRDLHALAHQGLIAVAGKEAYLAPSTTITEETYQLKLADNCSEKLAIAKAAVTHLQENIAVFFGRRHDRRGLRAVSCFHETDYGGEQCLEYRQCVVLQPRHSTDLHRRNAAPGLADFSWC